MLSLSLIIVLSTFDYSIRRETRFNNVFSEIMRREMAESIEISELLDKVNTVCLNDKFTSLELRANLQRLDAENRVMVTWESGTVYMI